AERPVHRRSRSRRRDRRGDRGAAGAHPRGHVPPHRSLCGRRRRRRRDPADHGDGPGWRALQAGHGDPQLRAHARVPRGRVLQRGQREGQPDRHRADVRAGRRPARERARHDAPGRPRREGRQEAELRLQGLHQQGDHLPQDRSRSRGHGRRRLPGAGDTDQVDRRPRVGRSDPRRRGPSRRLGARHPRRRQGPEPRARGLQHRQVHEADPRCGRRDRLHQEL
ncbi:MAG: hypothetical protein AVDCRST_MAG85-3827, partial [uncultured Solirubrobacteraceae bacterium]